MITGLHTIWCQVSDMDRAVAFYRDVLGLTPGFTTPYWSDFSVGEFKVGLHPKLKNATEPLGMYEKGWLLGFACDDLKGLRQRLQDAGTTIHGDYHEVPGGVVLDFVDPDGNPLEAHQAGAKMADLK